MIGSSPSPSARSGDKPPHGKPSGPQDGYPHVVGSGSPGARTRNVRIKSLHPSAKVSVKSRVTKRFHATDTMQTHSGPVGKGHDCGDVRAMKGPDSFPIPRVSGVPDWGTVDFARSGWCACGAGSTSGLDPIRAVI